MKMQRALLLSTIGLLIALSLVVGCAPQRKVLPDSEETPAAGKDVDVEDVERRFRRIVDAFAADELERETDSWGRPLNKWQCPTHDDENPSLSVNPDYDTGNILAYCHSGPECGDGYPEGGKTGWLRELARCLDIPISTFFPTRTAPDGYDQPF